VTAAATIRSGWARGEGHAADVESAPMPWWISAWLMWRVSRCLRGLARRCFAAAEDGDEAGDENRADVERVD
jgi:hypothetical protein